MKSNIQNYFVYKSLKQAFEINFVLFFLICAIQAKGKI